MNPHDEPADVAGELGQDGEDDDSDAKALVASQWADHCKGNGGDRHAAEVDPTPPKSVDQELADENRGKFSEREQAEVDKHVSSKILHVHGAGNVEVVVDTPDGGKG